MKRTVIVHPDPQSLAAATASRLVTALLDAQSTHAPVHVVLTGGSIGIETLRHLASSPALPAVDWTNVHLWWGDERFLPAGHPDRNETQARAALIDHIDIPAANVHAMAGTDLTITSPEAAAAAYGEELARFRGNGAAVPDFDVLLLGMGPDGHIASLFPGHAALRAGGLAVAIHNAPKPPPTRISLTFASIYSAKQVWIVCAGEEKAQATSYALCGADVDTSPAGAVHGSQQTLWLIDAAAALGAPGLA